MGVPLADRPFFSSASSFLRVGGMIRVDLNPKPEAKLLDPPATL